MSKNKADSKYMYTLEGEFQSYAPRTLEEIRSDIMQEMDGFPNNIELEVYEVTKVFTVKPHLEFIPVASPKPVTPVVTKAPSKRLRKVNLEDNVSPDE